MNVNLKKLLALLTALVLIATMAGCLEKTEKVESADAVASSDPAAPAEAAADIDYTAPAIELGSTVITVQDIADMYASYTSYMEYYGMEVDTASALGYAEESCVRSFVNVWQADVQGLTLTDEELAQVAEDVKSYRQEIIDSYIDYLIEQGTAEADATEDAAMSVIEQDLANNGYVGGLDAYIEANVEAEAKNAALVAKVQDAFNAGISVTDEEIKTWYDTTVESQKTTFEATPADYASVVGEFTSGASKTPALVAPEGYLRVKLALIAPEGTLDAKYDENKTEMDALAAEYGALILNNENAARQAEIKTEYASLKTENNALYEAYIVAARENANKAQAALASGTAFEDVMKTFGTAELTDDEIASGELLYTVEGQDDTDAAILEAVKNLKDGEYAKAPIQVGDTFYLVLRVGEEAAGTKAFEDCKELCAAAALADKQATEWTAVSETWYNEALEIAVYHKDAYAAIAE